MLLRAPLTSPSATRIILPKQLLLTRVATTGSIPVLAGPRRPRDQSMEYRVARYSGPPGLCGCNWESPAWAEIMACTLGHFREESSSHRPETTVRLAHTPTSLRGLFRVQDRFVVCRHDRCMDPVCQDSCVELFVRPTGAQGYFNFELNCGGALHSSYVLDHRRESGRLRDCRPIPVDLAKTIAIETTMPPIVDPEVPGPVTWLIEIEIPLDLIAHFVPLRLPLSGQRWTGNFYKCADRSSHPHWASWAPVDRLNFHLPECFGILLFE